MGKWIGPRRAMLLTAIACIGVGWYFKDFVVPFYIAPLAGFDVNIGSCFIMAGVGLIAITMIYSLVNSC